MTHALITAAREFDRDETRRVKRDQKPRLELIEHFQLQDGLAALDSTKTPAGVEDEKLRAIRGSIALGIFGYDDTTDEIAATVITDILHAAYALGYSPQAVLNQAAAYYAEEQ